MLSRFCAIVSCAILAGAAEPQVEGSWAKSIGEAAAKLQKKFKGRIAAYIVDPTLGVRVGLDAERPSYLASGVKLAFLIEVYRQAHEGRLSLDEEMVYEQDDVRDGAPKLNPRPFGTKLKIRELLEYMIRFSDNAASDMLARRVGVHNINHGLKSLGFDGFTPITTLIDVRRGILREVDLRADDFTAADIRAVRWVTGWQAQTSKLTELLGRPPGTYKKEDLQAAYHRYYESETNCARLDTVAHVFERMIARTLISPEASEAMLGLLSQVETSKTRILGKLPSGTKVAHKTGSQYERICDLGVIYLPDNHPLIMTSCLAGGDDRNLAEATLAELARHAYDLAVAAHRPHALRAATHQ
jgi:beta-lactamase class A